MQASIALRSGLALILIICLGFTPALSKPAAALVGTSNAATIGVDRLASEPEKFITYQNNPDDANSLSNNAVQAIFVDKAGRLWAGTAGGLNRFNRRTFRRYLNDPENPNSLSSDSVMGITQDAQSVLWVGTTAAGLNRFDGQTFTRYNFDPKDPASLGGDQIDTLYADRKGGLWIAVHGVGLDYFDGETFTHYKPDETKPDSLPDAHIDAIFEDSKGNIWLASTHGLARLDPSTGKFTHYPLMPEQADGKIDSRLLTIYGDSDETLAIGRVLDEIRTQDVALAESLKLLTQNFQYGKILQGLHSLTKDASPEERDEDE